MQGHVNYIGFAFHIVLPVMMTIADWLPASLLNSSSPYPTLWVLHESLRTCSSLTCSLDMYGPHTHMHTSHTCTHSHHTCKHMATHQHTPQTAPMHTSQHTHITHTHSTYPLTLISHTHIPPSPHTDHPASSWGDPKHSEPVCAVCVRDRAEHTPLDFSLSSLY